MRRNLVNRFEEPMFRNVLVDMYCARSGQLDFEYSKPFKSVISWEVLFPNC